MNKYFHEILIGEWFWFAGKSWRKLTKDLADGESTTRCFGADETVVV